jgi:hypothetical protein
MENILKELKEARDFHQKQIENNKLQLDCIKRFIDIIQRHINIS